jgi:hypothetical protein
MPDWWEGVLLALAAWRVWHLLAEDTILDKPRRYITRLDPGWQEDGDPEGDRYRFGLAEFIQCPYCFGAWIALGWVIAFAVFPTETMWATLPFAVNAGVIAMNHWMTSDE